VNPQVRTLNLPSASGAVSLGGVPGSGFPSALGKPEPTTACMPLPPQVSRSHPVRRAARAVRVERSCQNHPDVQRETATFNGLQTVERGSFPWAHGKLDGHDFVPASGIGRVIPRDSCRPADRRLRGRLHRDRAPARSLLWEQSSSGVTAVPLVGIPRSATNE